jgi:hypothetical protein
MMMQAMHCLDDDTANDDDNDTVDTVVPVVRI